MILIPCHDIAHVHTDTRTHAHRVGRTARYEAEGNSLLMLTPSEKVPFLEHLERKRIPITEITINPEKVLSITRQLTSFCTEFPEIKYLGQKHFISYYRSIYLKKDKAVFQVESMDANAFAASLGLPGTPKIKIGSKTAANVAKNNPRPDGTHAPAESEALSRWSAQPRVGGKAAEAEKQEQEDAAATTTTTTTKKPVSKVDKMFAKKNLTILSSHYQKLRGEEESVAEGEGEGAAALGDGAGPLDSDSDADLLTLARKDHGLEDLPATTPADAKTATKKAKKAKATRVVFGEDGETLANALQVTLEQAAAMTPAELAARQQEQLAARMQRMTEADQLDKLASKQRLKERKQLVKQRDREERRQQSGGDAVGVTLAPMEGEEEGSGYDSIPEYSEGEYESGKSATEYSGSEGGSDDDEQAYSEIDNSEYSDDEAALSGEEVASSSDEATAPPPPASKKRKHTSTKALAFSAKKIKEMEVLALGLLERD
jgi:ATP-dependent RNA helicase DDX10/DBP4